MDANRFDALAKTLTGTRSRRSAIGSVVAGLGEFSSTFRHISGGRDLQVPPVVTAWRDAWAKWEASGATLRALAETQDDLFGLLAAADPATLPALFLDCGTEDQLLDHNRRFLAAAEEHGVDLTPRLRPGAHTWEFWDQGIQDVLNWLPLRG